MTIYRRELEAALATLDSVASVRVVLDGRSVDEVGVIAAPGIGADAVVRDVRRRAVARFGVVVDPASVTVTTVVPAGR